MKFEFLGAYGGDTENSNLTSFLVDDTLALDAGSLTETLSLDRQEKIQNVFISHSHLDHMLSLPFLTDNLFDLLDSPLQVWGSAHVISALKSYLFNDVVWPDFSVLPSPEKPTIIFHTLKAEETIKVGHLEITPIPVNHIVPCFGYLVACEKSKSSVLYTADTTSTERIWEIANSREDLAAVIIDCSFPNDKEDLAKQTGHFSPNLMMKDIAKLKRDCQILVYHIKPTFMGKMLEELQALNDPRLILSIQNKTMHF